MNNTSLNPINSEKSLLGSLLVDSSIIIQLKQLKPFMFSEGHKKIAELIWQRYEEAKQVEMSIISDRLGDRKQVMDLVRFTDAINAVNYETEIVQCYQKREFLKLNDTFNSKIIQGEELIKVYNEIESEKVSIFELNEVDEDTRVEELKKVADQIMEASNMNGLTGINTGYKEMNDTYGGWQRTDQVIIAARPGMGKTTYALNLALLSAMSGATVVIFSLEMSKNQIWQKLISSITQISTIDMRKGLSEEQKPLVFQAVEFLNDQKIIIETGKNDIASIKSRVRLLNAKYGIDLIVVDYLQLVQLPKSKGKSKNDVIEEISRQFKLLAGDEDCNCTNIILSQLNRSVEIRGGMKRPMLSDLRSSGAIEQDADSVQLLYRPAYYDIFEDEQLRDVRNVIEIDIAKNRHGVLKVVRMIADLKNSAILENGQDNPFLKALSPKTGLNNHDQMKSARENNQEILPF